MVLKIYASIWILGILAAALFYLTGNLTGVAAVVFGFLTFGAVFLGFMSVLPLVEFHPPSEKP